MYVHTYTPVSAFCQCIQILIQFDAMWFDSFRFIFGVQFVSFFFVANRRVAQILRYTYTHCKLSCIRIFYGLLLENMNFSRIFNAMKFTWTRTLRFSFRLITFVSDIESPWWKSRTVGTKQLFYRFARHPNWIASLPDTFKYGLWFYNVLLKCFFCNKTTTSAKPNNKTKKKKEIVSHLNETKTKWIRYRKVGIILPNSHRLETVGATIRGKHDAI